MSLEERTEACLSRCPSLGFQFKSQVLFQNNKRVLFFCYVVTKHMLFHTCNVQPLIIKIQMSLSVFLFYYYYFFYH